MKKILEKLFCLHEWEVIAVAHYIDADVYLLKCNKCGKLVTKEI